MTLHAWRIGALGLALLGLPATAGEAEFLTIASTTSTDHSGLYDHLLPIYERQSGVLFRVVAVGTGQAIRNAMRGDADLLIVHHQESEERFVADGYGLRRHPLMHNDFVLLGPARDPARVAAADDVFDALRRIAQSEAPFISRGDDSGTHKRELRLWKRADTPVREASGSWYWESGSGMGPTLNMAASRDAYTLSDRATWSAFGNRQNLIVLHENALALRNQYSVIVVNPERHTHVKQKLAQNFVDWLLSEAGQQAIADFRINGKQMFYPNAAAP